MKTLQLLLLAVLIGMAPACGQEKKNRSAAPDLLHGSLLLPDTMSKPSYQARVNKQYDNQGRLTHYDSTYTYSWHGSGGNLTADADSLFRSFFGGSSSVFDQSMLKPWRAPDSLFFHSAPFNADFFRQYQEMSRRLREQFYRRSDSLQWPGRMPTEQNRKTI